MKQNCDEIEKLIHFEELYQKKEEAIFIEYRFLACIFYILASIMQALPYSYVIKNPVFIFFLIAFFLIGLRLEIYLYMNYKTATSTIGVYDLMEQFCVSQMTIFRRRLKQLTSRILLLLSIGIGLQIVFRFAQGNAKITMILYPMVVQAIVAILTIVQILPWSNLLRYKNIRLIK